MSDFEQDWKQWHADREASYGDPLGWVSLTGLYWLTDEFETVADLPGRWKADADSVTVQGFDGVSALNPVEGAPGILVEDGERRIEVIRRTGSVALRVHDPKAQTLQSYSGIPAYEPSEKFVVTGTFTPYDSPVTVTTGAVVEGLEHHHTAVGTLDFELAGTEQQLIAFGGNGNGLKVLFTDATSGVTTYPAARILSIATPESGSVVLDFNRASNLPCAFTDFATCPVAPTENRLTVAVEAGEKNPR
ncbi:MULTISPECIES: DUF1684 domain-containing protein [Rhodococcus]|uniref:DUF1684 domain-containing protein n=1 Tax=Rhodococcus cerastii TaxID=908616 RepID=A0ABU4D5G5_9NOCA|nr:MULTISPECIES: DUF1684 domain-containing protein [Rhodococcus]KAA0925114.1 DUF1684 domain-containing protein [Rhodococcus sp. ANT_H53B]MDV6304978.1 DUF1684 domain-containing protein [Rhodococcus cerastii]MDV7989410.1 DUF1684 domain-containing protein [Rhodococcus sp. IEGM 1374]